MINDDLITQRRNFCVRNIVRDFLLAFKFFRELKLKYKDSGIGSVDFDVLITEDKTQGLLKRIIESCSLIWGKKNHHNDDAFYFVTIINLIYYDTCKLRELCEFIEYHDNLFNKLNIKAKGPFFKYHEFIDTIFLELRDGFYKVDNFFKEASNHLKTLIVKEKQNSLLVRFLLIEGRNLLKDVWCQYGEVDELLSTLFPEGLDQAYCFAAEDYFEGSWFDKAKDAYLNALRINPKCEQAIDGLRLLDKRLNELAHIQEKEKERFLFQ